MAKDNNLQDLLTDIADAIREKKGTTEKINAQDFSAEIASIESGGGSVVAASVNDVNFRDYDGTILYSYTKEDFLKLKELPALPERDGLICQEWNWDFADAQEYVSEYGRLEVGATYITDDGKTRLYITIAAEGRMDVPLLLQQSVSNGVVIDWGDGSATETFTEISSKILSHTYSKVGDYIITLEVTSGTLSIFGSAAYGIIANSMSVYSNMLQKVEIGNGVKSIGTYAFRSCYSLVSVVIPNGVTSIGDNAFYFCNSLASVVIPNSVTKFEDYAFQSCYSLASVVIPNSVTDLGGYTFQNCYSLASVVIPNSVTLIYLYTFRYCYSLASVVIPNSVTGIGSNAFQSCYSLASVVIPNGVKEIQSSVFESCYSLVSVVIPSSVTIIRNSAFESCYSLVSVVIPSSVTIIQFYVFGTCKSVAFFDFRTHTFVPTLSATSAFTSIPSDCKIVVPDALYDEWIAATNWSTYASNIVKASEYNG